MPTSPELRQTLIWLQRSKSYDRGNSCRLDFGICSLKKELEPIQVAELPKRPDVAIPPTTFNTYMYILKAVHEDQYSHPYSLSPSKKKKKQTKKKKQKPHHSEQTGGKEGCKFP